MRHLDGFFQEYRTGSIQNELKRIEDTLNEDARWDNNMKSINVNKSLVQQRNQLLHTEEMKWRQRSRAIWLDHGDKNSKFFTGRRSKGEE